MKNQKKPSRMVRGISDHFEREAKIMVGLILTILLLGMVAALIGPWIFEWIR